MSSILSSIDASVEMAFAEALTRFVLAGLVASLVVVFVGVLALPARPLVRRPRGIAEAPPNPRSPPIPAPSAREPAETRPGQCP